MKTKNPKGPGRLGDAPASHKEVPGPTTDGTELFALGAVYATPATLHHLATSGIAAAALLVMHQGGEWGALDDDDIASNREALKTGARILSRFILESENVYVITDAANEHGLRTTTTMLLAPEH